MEIAFRSARPRLRALRTCPPDELRLPAVPVQLTSEADEDRVLILRREGESLVTLDDEEQDRVVEQLEEFEEEEEVDEDGGPGH